MFFGSEAATFFEYLVHSANRRTIAGWRIKLPLIALAAGQAAIGSRQGLRRGSMDSSRISESCKTEFREKELTRCTFAKRLSPPGPRLVLAG